MSEPKFRVWDGERMFYDGDTMSGSAVGILFIHGTWCLYLSNDDAGGSWLSVPGMALMQYADFKDSAGKDIYEDDIVEIALAPGTGVRPQRRIIDWDHGRLDALKSWLSAMRVRVIGNVHENPELLS